MVWRVSTRWVEARLEPQKAMKPMYTHQILTWCDTVILGAFIRKNLKQKRNKKIITTLYRVCQMPIKNE